MLKFPVLLLAAILSVGAVASSREDDIRGEVARALHEEELAGAVWTLVDRGAVKVAAAGLRNFQTGAAMTPSTRVQVGSIAKVVVATGVLRLISEGRLSLDTPVADLLPQLHFDNPWRADEPVRVRHLLTHTAGLENMRLSQVFSLKAVPDSSLQDVFSGDPSLLRAHSRPGSQYLYSNMGYTLLGLVIEAITGQRYEHYLDREVLQPLAMTDSTFEFVSQRGPHADPRLAMGYFEQGRTQEALPMFLRPAGQFTTTVEDIANLSLFLMGDGTLHGKPFIAPTLMAQLGWPSGTDAEEAGLRMGHGLSLAARDRHGVTGLCHPGTTLGFRAILCLFPGEQKAFFAAFNTDSETADYERFNAAFIRTLDIRTRAMTPAAPLSTALPDTGDWNGIYIPSASAVDAFAWIDTLFNYRHLSAVGEKLLLQPFAAEVQRLDPVGPGLFRAEGRRQASHVLFRDRDGTPTLSDGLHSYQRTWFGKILLLWASLGLGLLGLTYIFLVGLIRLFTGKLSTKSVLLMPFLACLALLLPIPFFFRQTFLQLGDMTAASILLTITTSLLPVALAAACALPLYRRRCHSKLDTAAVFAALQWSLVLLAWGMLPIRLWA